MMHVARMLGSLTRGLGNFRVVFSSLFLTDVQESKCVIRTEGAEFTSRLRFKSRDSDDVVLDVVDVHIVVILLIVLLLFSLVGVVRSGFLRRRLSRSLLKPERRIH